MTALCIPLSQRLRLSNEMAKLMIEEKKLEQMNGAVVQEVNPLLTLLKDDDYEYNSYSMKKLNHSIVFQLYNVKFFENLDV